MISVVVPAYNAQDTLDACLAALEKQTTDRARYEIIVVDDGSTDRTRHIAARHEVLLCTQPNAGPAAARNRGAQTARGELVLFTDADCEPAEDWIERISEPFGDPALVGAKGVYRTRQSAWVARFVQAEYEDRYRRMARQMRREGRIDFVDTYSAAYRRDVFLANQGFDTTFPAASVEDQEFSFRLARKGYLMRFAPGAAVYHRHDATVAEYWQRKFRIGYWKALLLRSHPDRVVADSHTPQVLKLQMGLAALLFPALALGSVWPPARWVAAGLALSLLLSGLPLQVRVGFHDLPVALLSPAMLLVRALSLGLGLCVGFLRFRGQAARERAPIGAANGLIKRVIDLVCSGIGLIVSAPLLAILGLWVRLDSPGRALFFQERVGKDGRPFRMVKLRTMVEGAEDISPMVQESSPSAHLRFKRPEDPRVTRLGRFLRRTSLDELPQLWNVFRGEMSLVGPRPEEARVVRLYDDGQRRRLAVKPGMTGPMQVSGRADLSLDERMRLELDYIERYSLWRDLCILARTVGALVSGRGAY